MRAGKFMRLQMRITVQSGRHHAQRSADRPNGLGRHLTNLVGHSLDHQMG